MPQNTHVETAVETNRTRTLAAEHRPEIAALQKNAEEIAKVLAWNPSVLTSGYFSARWKAMAASLRPTLERIGRSKRKANESDDLRWVRENLSLLWAALWNTRNAFKLLRRLPHVKTPRGTVIPRAAALAEAYLYAANFDFNEPAFVAYLDA